MTTYTWQNGVSGDWSNAADWTPGGVPGSGDTAEIGTGGTVVATDWTVTVTSELVASVLFAASGANGTLSVTGLLDASDGITLASGMVRLQTDSALVTPGALTLGVAGAAGSAATLVMAANGATTDLIAAASLALFDGSTLNVNDAQVALGQAVAVDGTIVVGGGATLSGDVGTIVGDVADNGTMSVLAVAQGESLGALTVTGTLTDGASLDVAAAASLAVLGDLILAGPATVVMGGGASLAVQGTLAIAGALTAMASGARIAAGQLVVTGTLDATDATVTAGALTLSGTVALVGGTLAQTGGGAVSVTAGSVTLSGGAALSATALTVAGVASNHYTATFAAGTGETVAITGGITLGQDTYAGTTDLQALDASGTLLASGGGIVATGLTLFGFGSNNGAADGSSVVVSGGGAIVLGDAAAVAGAVAVGGDATIAGDRGVITANVALDGALIVGATGFGGTLAIDGTLSGQGTVVVLDGLVTSQEASPTLFESPGTLQLASAANFTGDITLDAGATLAITSADLPTGRIVVRPFAGATPDSATVELQALTYEAFNIPIYNPLTGLLAVGTATLDVGLGYSAAAFRTQAASRTGTDVLIAPTPCYAAGTGIATPHGNVPVEALRPGDMVVTREGARPVRWVGRFTVDLDRHPAPAQAAPIRIRAHAMAENVPARELLVSPDHALFIDGVLMQAQSLVNGATILREPAAGRITYFHVELDRHAILFAEGLAAESYLDTGNRGAFAGEAGARPLFADLTRRTWAADACAPLLLDGAAVVAAHCRLLARAHALGHRLTADPALAVLADGVPLDLCQDAALCWRARVPAGAARLRLRSHGFVPDELDRAAGDRRRLGIAVTALRLAGRALHPEGDGWHAAEAGWRWTDGDAAVRLPRGRRPGWLRLTAAAVGARYWTRAAPASTPVRRRA